MNAGKVYRVSVKPLLALLQSYDDARCDRLLEMVQWKQLTIASLHSLRIILRLSFFALIRIMTTEDEHCEVA